MEKTFDIFFEDLVPEKQKEILKFLNIETPQDGNCDVFPLTVISIEDVDKSNDAVKSVNA